MKPIRTFITWSLLGSLWLAACSGSNKKRVLTPEADAGAAGESAGGANSETPAGGAAGDESQAAGAAGTTGGSAGAAGALGEAGTAGSLSSAGQGGEGGAPPVCFAALTAPPEATGEGGATSLDLGTPGHGEYSCSSLLTALSPVYDSLTGKLSLDASQLGPVASGDFSFYYEYYDGETNQEGCQSDAVAVTGQQLTLSLDVPLQTSGIYVTALQLRDQCGGDASLSTAGKNGTCINLHLLSTQEGWTIDCYEGGCFPACGADPGASIPPIVSGPPEGPNPNP